MKHIINTIIFFSLFMIAACEKGDPEIAPLDELSVIGMSESFMCQPLAYTNHLVALIDNNNLNYLVNYDEQGNKIWQRSVDEFIVPGLTYYNVNYLNLAKTANSEIIIEMFIPRYNQSQQLVNQIIKAVNFDASGNFLWQFTDSIHQPDTMIINLDTIQVNSDFIAGGFVHLSTGNHLVVSSQIDTNIDSTYIQLTAYGSNGVFINNSYLKLQGTRTIHDVYLTSNDEFFIYNSISDVSQSYILLDLSGNIIFEVAPPNLSFYENYFFHETSQGNFIISSSFFDEVANFKGVVFCINSSGNLLWSNNIDSPQALMMMSVQEKSDGLIFSGFNTGTALLAGVDWRTTFAQNKYTAVIQKIGLDGKEIWINRLQVISNTAGAATVGADQIAFFGGKYDITIRSIYLLKFDASGQILN